MEDSQPQPQPQPQPSQNNVFSVRIVSIDYYMAAPIPDLDICYSSFQGGKVNEVPVIRIYGSTPAGQKTCLHIHRALPYLYIPFADLMLQSVQEGDACTQLISLSLEKVLKLKASAGLKRQHVHGCSLVRARRFYGYHSSEELFVKIYLYHPNDVSRAANLLLGGAVLDRSFQPHESHIPFLLQFLVDYNLYGMAHLHASKMKFRRPVPNASGREKYRCNETRLGRDNPTYTSSGFQADSRGDESLRSPIWISSTVPDGWIWECQCQLDSSSCENVHHVKRQSTCELEGDTTVDEILNQQFKMYSSLSQTSSDLKMVQSLIPIWEEYERTGVHEVPLASDPEKPLPKDILRTLSLGLDEFECKFVERCKETTNDLPCTPSEKVPTTYSTVEGTMVEVGLCDLKEAGGEASREALKCLELGSKTGMVLPPDLPCEHDNIIVPGEGKLLYPKQLLASDMQPTTTTTTTTTTQTTMQSSDVKVVDKEAMGLLSWLASSQAAEDINSDDDLACETILTPLLPATTIDKVLEKANMDFESESQQECKDILDSVENLIDFEVIGERTSSTNHNYLNQSSSGIPQMDGSADDQNSMPDNGKSSMEIYNEIKRFLDDDVQQATHASFTSTSKRSKPLWGSLPFSSKQEMNDVVQPPSKCYNEMNKDKFAGSIVGNDADIVFNVSKEESTLVGCSVRDLMRKKRCFHSEPSEFESQGIQKAVSKEELHQKQLSTGILQNHGQDIQEMSIAYCKKDNMDEPEFVGSMEPGTFDACIGKSDRQVKDTELSVPPSSVSSAIALGENPVELIGMTFHQKPPLLNRTVGTLDTPMSYANIAQRNCLLEEESFEGTSAVQRQLIEEFPPFFGKDCLVDGDIQKKSPSSNELDHHECAIGVPTHYQNDGSYLYMLTPVFSPPSADTVSRWLLHDNSVDDLGEHTKAVAVDSPSPKGFSGSQSSSQGSLIDEKHSPQCGSVFRADHIVDEQKQQSHKDLITEINPCVMAVNAIGQIEYNIVKQEECSDCPLDISQISGPDCKSKPTPLSQIGFQDPASFGGGQQLTLLSIEVQAETRGDLQPDPRFDAINVIVLAFQEDNDSSSDVYVLLRSDADHHSNLNGISGCKMLVSLEEKQLFSHFMNIICSTDPDILIGWDIQGSSLGFLAERAIHLGINLLNCISRLSTKTKVAAKESSLSEGGLPEPVDTKSIPFEDPVIEDEWGRTHASGIHVGGRVVLNVWRLMRGELKLNMYTVEAVTEAVLRRKVPSIPHKVLARWFSSGPGRARYRCIEYMVGRANLNLEIINQLDMINRTSELARIFGIDFFSVLSRGSQYRVESMFLRLAHTQNYVAISPGNQQVAYQPAMECLPLVMEPESGFYMDPVVVLDFQSLYPSMIIAYNLCFCTCLGNIMPSKTNTLGVSSYSPDLHVLRSLKDELLLTPNGVMYVPSKVRKGVLPRLLEEILSTRIMVKQAMKNLASSQQVLRRIYNARHLALKLIANVTYGYTAAGFSGRMPCAELADSIVQCGRRTLENAITFVNSHDKWKAEVIYGDTDSMFVLLRGRSIKEAFEIGNDIASAVTAANPNPVTLKMEKVYHPCFLLTKKRYVGYSYENPDQVKPIFDAKGIETVRRDTCPAVAKIMEQSLRIFFEHKDIHKVKAYLLRQWTRILSGRVSLQDFVFAKEVRLGAYSSRASSSIPPAAIVATKAMRADPRAEPRYAERIPYVVVHGEPGSRLVDMVVDPLDLLAINSPFRLNDTYYITKQIIPALQRVFGLVGADLNQWFSDMPRPVREFVAKRHSFPPGSHRTRIDYYYLSKHCILCGDLVQGAAHLCGKCSKNKAASVTAIVGRTSKLEKEIQHLAAICRHCGGGDWLLESGVKCTSLACSVFYERRKVQKELQSLSSIATDAGLYPRCMVEWF